MSLDDLIFIDNLPKIDLHGLDQNTAALAIRDFIRDAKATKEEFIVIIHGKGSGTLKKLTREELTHHKDVLEFKLYYFNDGCTLVHIKI